MSKIKFTQDQADLLRNAGTVIKFPNGNKYMYLPFWYKDSEDNVLEEYNPDKIPDELREELKSQREAKEQPSKKFKLVVFKGHTIQDILGVPQARVTEIAFNAQNTFKLKNPDDFNPWELLQEVIKHCKDINEVVAVTMFWNQRYNAGSASHYVLEAMSKYSKNNIKDRKN